MRSLLFSLALLFALPCFADLPPTSPDGKLCLVEAQQKEGATCERCEPVSAECEASMKSKGFSLRCEAFNRSVKTQVWCKEPQTAPAEPPKAATVEPPQKTGGCAVQPTNENAAQFFMLVVFGALLGSRRRTQRRQ